MVDVKIRPLTRADRKTLTRMIEKLVKQAGNGWLTELISGDVAETSEETAGSNNRYINLAMALFQKLLATLEEDFCEWLRSLVGATVEDFDAMPIGVELAIIKQVVESPEGVDFFTLALDLVKKTEGFASQFQGKKTK